LNLSGLMGCGFSHRSQRMHAAMEDIILFREALLLQFPKLAVNSHVHTDASDGELSLEDTAWTAWTCGFADICITDHNAFGFDPGDSRHARTAESFGRLGLKIRPGIEMSCMTEWGTPNREVHIVGVNVRPKGRMMRRLDELQESRIECMIESLERIRSLGYTVAAYEELAGRYPNVTLAHIARSIKDKNGMSVDADAFKKEHLWPGKDCYVSKDLFSVPEAIDLIEYCGGRSVLAHPRATFTPKVFDGNFEGEAKRYVDMDIGGIECETKTQTASGCRRVDDFCREHGVKSFAASDAHSKKDYLIYARQLMDVYWGTDKNRVDRLKIEQQDY